MSDFLKILDHPEKDKIVGKLISGEPSSKVAEYLKIKYPHKDEVHLRISSKLLKEFTDKYLDQYDSLDKIIEAEKNNKLDKKIAQSLINNKTWQERIAETADLEIDIKKKIAQVLTIIEARTEQVFDQIQQKPEAFKGDYVLIKYFEVLFNAMEKFDKIVNERPDQVVEHNYNIQMVQQHSAVLQEAIRDVLREMDPEYSALFLDRLNERMRELEDPTEGNVRKTLSVSSIEHIEKQLPEAIDAEFTEDTGGIQEIVYE